MYGSNARKSGLGGFARGLTIKGPMIGNMIDNEGDEMDDDSFEPDMQEVGMFLGKILMSTPIIHMLHLQTDSFAKHLALGGLYESLPGDIDTIVEEFQGMYGIINSYETYVSYNANPLMFVEDLLSHVKRGREVLGPCSSINSNLDILETSIKSCLYKLKHLK